MVSAARWVLEYCAGLRGVFCYFRFDRCDMLDTEFPITEFLAYTQGLEAGKDVEDVRVYGFVVSGS